MNLRTCSTRAPPPKVSLAGRDPVGCSAPQWRLKEEREEAGLGERKAGWEELN